LERHEGAFGVPARVCYRLKASWQKQVLASSGYHELGMFEDAAQPLEEIEPEDKTRSEALDDYALSTLQWVEAAPVPPGPPLEP
jgi:hypothetical protein